MCDAARQGRACDELEHECRGSVRFFQFVDVRDGGMIEGGEHLRFALEARQSLGVVRDRAQQHFDRDVAIQLRVARAIHGAHAAFPE